MRLHPHQRRVVVRRQHVGVADGGAAGCAAFPATLKTALVRIGLPGVTAGNPGDVDHGAGLDPLRLLGLDPRPAGPVVDVEHVADVAELGGGGEVVDLDGMPGGCSW